MLMPSHFGAARRPAGCWHTSSLQSCSCAGDTPGSGALAAWTGFLAGRRSVNDLASSCQRRWAGGAGCWVCGQTALQCRWPLPQLAAPLHLTCVKAAGGSASSAQGQCIEMPTCHSETGCGTGACGSASKRPGHTATACIGCMRQQGMLHLAHAGNKCHKLVHTWVVAWRLRGLLRPLCEGQKGRSGSCAPKK